MKVFWYTIGIIVAIVQAQINEYDDNNKTNLAETDILTKNLNTSECIITKDELTQMKNEIVEILQLEHSHIIESICNSNLETNNCSGLIKFLKCGIQYFKNQLDMTSNEVSSNDVTKWKMKYEKLYKKYIKLEDDLYKSNNQKNNAEINDINQGLQHCKQVINKLEQDLNVANKNIIEITINLCSSEIHSKKVHQCVEKLNNLTSITSDIINKIIHRSSMYIINDNDMITIAYIIDFINTLELDLKKTGYDQLYEIMNDRNFLYSPYILTFGSKVQNYYKPGLISFVKNKIDEWSKNIINANYMEIIAYAENQEFSFRYYLKDLIAHTFNNNVNNPKKIIYFLDNLPSKQKYLSYYILYNEIKLKQGINGQEIIMLIYRIKDIIDHDTFNELEENVKIKLKRVLLELPSWIKVLLYDKVLSIRSRFNNYKLISLHKYFGFIYIDTILAICPLSMNGADKWKTTVKENGKFFQINNIDNKHDKQYEWEIHAYNNGQHTYFVDKNSGNKLYTKETIGGWIGFWYQVPRDCYQVYYDYNENNFQQWLIF